MSYTRCAYYDCENTSKNTSMFRFPVHDSARAALWIKHSGNCDLIALTNDELIRRFICAVHFRPSCISIGKQRSRLLGPPVPLPYEPTPIEVETIPSTSCMDIEFDVPSPECLKVKTPIKDYTRHRTPIHLPMDAQESNSPSTSSTIFGGPFMFPTPTRRLSRKCLFEQPKKRLSRKCLFEENSNDSPQKKRLKRSASKYLKKTKVQQGQIRRLKKKCAKNKKLIDLDAHDFRSDASKILTLMQFRKKYEKTPLDKSRKKTMFIPVL